MSKKFFVIIYCFICLFKLAGEDFSLEDFINKINTKNEWIPIEYIQVINAKDRNTLKDIITDYNYERVYDPFCEKWVEWYEKYSIEELKDICRQKDIELEEGLSKEDIIEKLIAPIIIDLAGNYHFIKELETNVKDRVKAILESKDSQNERIVKLGNTSFDIDVLNVDLYEML